MKVIPVTWHVSVGRLSSDSFVGVFTNRHHQCVRWEGSVLPSSLQRPDVSGSVLERGFTRRRGVSRNDVCFMPLRPDARCVTTL